MVKVGDNIVITMLSGKLGNLIVFRNHSGKTYVAIAPKKKITESYFIEKFHSLFIKLFVFNLDNVTNIPTHSFLKHSFTKSNQEKALYFQVCGLCTEREKLY